ncbi:MAG: 2-hydroxychromene-2-carboxylate isomerase [Burkholderiaceae bacterium]
MKIIDYYMVTTSPWTYLGHERLARIAADTGAEIRIKTMDLGRVFPISGGLPLPKRAPQRQAYRLAELKRWSEHLGLPLNLHPRHFPADPMPSLRMIAAARIVAGEKAAFELASHALRATWAEERDVANPDELDAMATACGLSPGVLRAAEPAANDEIDLVTERAIALQVFGAPWYQVGDEGFWGQDRLEFVERALRT